MPELDCQKFHSREVLGTHGFAGFKSVGELINDCYSRQDRVMKSSPNVPEKKGVYMVLTPRDFCPTLVLAGENGFLGGKADATLEYLNKKWVEDTIVTYIGQAGGGSSSEVLQERIRRYLKHGLRGRGGHRGGRLIWHISNPLKLVVCWKVLVNDDPSRVESVLLDEFEECYRSLPFGNIKRGKTYRDG